MTVVLILLVDNGELRSFYAFFLVLTVGLVLYSTNVFWHFLRLVSGRAEPDPDYAFDRNIVKILLLPPARVLAMAASFALLWKLSFELFGFPAGIDIAGLSTIDLMWAIGDLTLFQLSWFGSAEASAALLIDLRAVGPIEAAPFLILLLLTDMLVLRTIWYWLIYILGSAYRFSPLMTGAGLAAPLAYGAFAGLTADSWSLLLGLTGIYAPAVLVLFIRNSVSSPGGSTEAGFEAFEAIEAREAPRQDSGFQRGFSALAASRHSGGSSYPRGSQALDSLTNLPRRNLFETAFESMALESTSDHSLRGL